jgi:hypothetical protein
LDWDKQVEDAIKLNKCTPTISLIYEKDKKFIWVSAGADKRSMFFVSQCYFPGEVSAWFGFSKKQGTVRLFTQSFSKENARKAMELFISKDYAALREFYAIQVPHYFLGMGASTSPVSPLLLFLTL